MRLLTHLPDRASLLQVLVAFTEDHQVGGPSVALRDGSEP